MNGHTCILFANFINDVQNKPGNGEINTANITTLKKRTLQARRHAVKSGPAEVRARAKDTSEGESTRGGIPPLVRGVRGISPEKMFDLWLPLCAF